MIKFMQNSKRYLMIMAFLSGLPAMAMEENYTELRKVPNNEYEIRCLERRKDNGEYVHPELFRKKALLSIYAEQNPNSLFYFSVFLEKSEGLSEKNLPDIEWRPIIDMCFKAAKAGSAAALYKLIETPMYLQELHKMQENVYQDVSILLAKDIMGKGGYQCGPYIAGCFQALYKQTNNNVFKIIRLLILNQACKERYGPEDMISRIESEYSNVFQTNYNFMSDYAPFSDYAPLLDLFTLEGPLCANSKFYFKLDKKSLNDIYEEMRQVEKHRSYYSSWDYKYQDYSHQYEKLKKEAEGRANIIQCVSNKDQIIDALSAEEQFHLAQEYNLINRVLEVIQPGPNNTSFRDSYYLCLKKAAANGYQPAREELVQLYSKGYVQKKYSARGHGYDRRFVQEESIFISPEEAAAYQQAVREAKEAEDAEFTDFLMRVE